MQNEKIDIKTLSIPELEQKFQIMDIARFHAKQVFRWLHRGAESFEEMSDLSREVRASLSSVFFITVPEIWKKQQSAEDGTVKYLWRLLDGSGVESVFMRYHHGNTICISTQVGCKMGCRFCASTKGGRIRNLRASEMLDQVIFSQKDTGENIANIVLMGTGEPLDNYRETLKFLRLVNHPAGLGKGFRHISLSTCGLCDKIQQLTKENLPITLSVSLHAVDDEVRCRLMPVNRRFPVRTLLETCESYYRQTGRRISYEYALISGVNDRPEDAEKLANALHGKNAHVNLIVLNRVEESDLQPSTKDAADRFTGILEKAGINVTKRRWLGRDIDAACGQLRRKSSAQK